MMKNVLVGIILFCSFSSFAQEGVEAPQTLEQQFADIMENTETFKEYKVIKIEQLRAFWSTVEDSINQKEGEISSAQQAIAGQNSEINDLKNTIEEGRASVEKAAYDREHITVMGIDFTKSAFIITSFVIIGALLVLLAIGYGKYKYSTKLAHDKTKSYDKLENEYKEYQDKSREKQMQLKRELQTHINKIEELKHKNISFK